MENKRIKDIIEKSDVHFFEKENWNSMSSVKVDTDIYRIDMDFSRQNGIINFSHEVSIFASYKNEKFDFLSGDELATDYIRYDKKDYNDLKERFPDIEDVAIKAIIKYENNKKRESVSSPSQSKINDKNKKEIEDTKKNNYISR